MSFFEQPAPARDALAAAHRMVWLVRVIGLVLGLVGLAGLALSGGNIFSMALWVGWLTGLAAGALWMQFAHTYEQRAYEAYEAYEALESFFAQMRQRASLVQAREDESGQGATRPQHPLS